MYELKNSGVADTSGAIILGSAFLIGAGSALALLLGALIEKKELIIVFLVMQFVVNTVELFYIILALMHGMEYNKFVFYVLPLFLLIYIIIVAYSYFRYIWEEY
ncbi:uncharacterized protein LOC115634276 [Scaptodrosophila lebanonensis]|uniref:Uncharacterized protein LOC115634276 n=1 Tax=Drosophila lebanonensis TaxID=7225 RepID=A0A6J2UHE5_DROLE|nr:uncharacterized protein LOC115634276 [Scaptodrosophila lebanonensis]